jgi:hypothetical protein
MRALLNTAATSIATVPIAKAASASAIAFGAPGAAYQSVAEALATTSAQAAIQGFFGPVASVMLPRTGDSSASDSPAAAVA